MSIIPPTPLTDQQIDALFNFVKSKYVDFYDVQVELVDHLASEVEARMAETPGVTFDGALQQVYGGFGIFGFSDLVEEKQKAADKRARVLWLKCVLDLFRLPFLIGSALGGILVWTSFNALETKNFLIINAALALIAIMVNAVAMYKSRPSRDYKITSYQYNGMIHFWNMFHFQVAYFFMDWMYVGYSYERYSVLIPLLCWASWIGFTANILSFEKLIAESRKQFPLAFA